MNKANTNKKANIIIGILIIAAGIGLMVTMIKSKKAPPRHTIVNKGMLVKTFVASKSPVRVSVEATGTVTADQKIDIIPQVGGKIVFVSKDFKKGSFFKTGELLYQIETADYLISAEKTKAIVAKAENDLLETKSMAEVALKEWEISQQFSKKTAASPLVLYKPQLKRAEAALDSAMADYKLSLLNIARTKLKAPFNCIINEEYIEKGKFISAGSKTAEILGTDYFDIELPLPYSEISLLKLPGLNNSEKGPAAEIYLQSGLTEYKWQAFVSRLLGNIEKNTYMPRLLLTVPDPYNLKNTHGKLTPPLAEGFFVKALIPGKTLDNVFSIPPESLRDNSSVWVYSEKQKLLIKKVSVLRSEKTRLIVSGDLNNGDQIITSSLNGAAEGMRLRTKMPPAASF